MSYTLNKETVAVMHPRILMCKVGNRKKKVFQTKMFYIVTFGVSVKLIWLHRIKNAGKKLKKHQISTHHVTLTGFSV